MAPAAASANASSSSSISPSGDNARQDRRVDIERVEKSVARQPAGAPRRQDRACARPARADRARLGKPRPAGHHAARRSASAGTAPTAGMVKTRGDMCIDRFRRRAVASANPETDEPPRRSQIRTSCGYRISAFAAGRRLGMTADLRRAARSRLRRPRSLRACRHASTRLRAAGRTAGPSRRRGRKGG